MADLKPFTGELDAPTSLKPFDGQLDGEKAKPASAMRKLGDLGLGFASGAVGATKALADVAGADNKASRVLGEINTGINDYLSPAAKADQQEQGRLMADAKAKGFNLDGIVAGAKAFAVAPAQAIAQGLGSVVPIIAGTALTGGVLPTAAAGAGIGVAMGAGTAKGAIFDEVKKRAIAKGSNEADATAEADAAQSYGGANTDQIALGGALGAADALTGVSAGATRMARNALGKPVAQAVTNAAEAGVMKRAGMGMLKEMPLEAAQGGQEQVAANVAAQRAGYEAGTFDNVASNATLEALASAGPGAAFGALDTQAKQTPPPVAPPAIDQLGGLPPTAPVAPPADPLQIGMKPDPLLSFADGTVARRSEMDAYINALPEDQRVAARAKAMGLGPQTVPPEFAKILDTDATYEGWSNVRDGTDRVVMRDQMDYVQKTYSPIATEAKRDEIAADLSQQFKWFRSAKPSEQIAAIDALIAAPKPPKPSEAMGINPNAGPISAAAALSVDTGITQDIQANEANAADQAAYEQATQAQEQQAAEQDTADKPITTGKLAEAAMSEEDKRAVLFSNKTVADGGIQYEGTQDGDILNGMGAPFATKLGAQRRVRMEGSDYTIAPVFDGYVARRKDAMPAETNTPAESVGGNIATQAEPENQPNQPLAAESIAPVATENVANEVAAITGNLPEVDREASAVLSDAPAPVTQLSPLLKAPDATKIPDASSGEIVAQWAGGRGQGLSEISAKIEKSKFSKSNPNSTVTIEDAGWKLKNGQNAKKLVARALEDSAPVTQPAQPVTGEGAGGSQPTQVAAAPAANKDQAKALDRIAKGTAYFGNAMKAGEFVAKNGLKETHKAVKTSATRWDIVAKDSQPKESTNGTQAPETVQAAQEGSKAPAAEVAPKQNTVESVARAVQIKVAQNRRKYRESDRAKRVAKGYAPNSTAESEQADYDEEISKEPGDVQKSSAANLIGTDPDALIAMFTKGRFEASEEVFKDLTGVKIKGLSVKEKKAALYKWAKWTPEQIAASEKKDADSEAARTEGFKQDDKESALRSSWRSLERLKVKNKDGKVLTGQEFIQSMVADGFDKAHTQKKGAITVYGLANGGQFTSLKNKDANDFLKAAIAYGGLDKALAFVDASKVPEIEEYQAAATVAPAEKNGKAEVMRELAKINEQMPEGFEAADGPLGVGLFQNGKPVENVQGLSRVNGYNELLRQAKRLADNGQNDWTTIGRNKAGKLIVADKRGVRSYVENGIRVTETVTMKPVRGGGIELSIDGRSDEYRSVEEIEAEKPAEPAKAPEAPEAPKVDSKPAPSTNTIFTQDAADAARARLKAKLGRMNSGLDPETMMDGITLAGYHIEKGARSFAAFTSAMIGDLGDAVKPYLKSWYMGVKFDPRAAAFDGMDSAAAVEGADLDKLAATDDAPQPTKTTLATSLFDAIQSGNMPKDNPALKKLVEAFDGKPADPARMKAAQEQLETAIVMTARAVVAKNEGDKTTFDVLERLYNSQPNLNIRTSTSIANQAYSTPAPLAFIASRLAGITGKSSVLEPTAGNGMLVIGANIDNTSTNEINDERIASLKSQGFSPSQNDATEGFANLAPQDAIVTNPPFGSVKGADGKPIKVKVDGYDIGQIDHLIAARALEKMKDDGQAVLIIGANKVAGGLNTDDRIFFNWLYGHYNVVGHFEVDGDLYTRQGAAWPVRVIAINGRNKSNTFSPLAGTVKRVNNWSEVYEQYQTILAASRQPVRSSSPSPVRAGGSKAGPRGVSVTADTKTPAVDRPITSGSPGGTGDVAGASTGVVPNSSDAIPARLGNIVDEQRLHAQSDGARGLEPTGAASAGATGRQPAKPAGTTTLNKPNTGNEFQAPYIPRSARKDEGVLIPTNMAQPTQDALSALEDEVGDIDEFARKELGYTSTDELHAALMGLQVDSVATAIYQIKKGKAVVIADQTGIGKGRQAAAIIRWAGKQGYTPVFISQKPSLFTDMYGDLADIGTNDVQPFVLNGDAWVAGADGGKLFANKPTTHKRRMEAIEASGQLPDGSNAVFMTYSQINKDNLQRRVLMSLAPNAVFILDESHSAAGASSTGEFVIGALGLAKGVTYLSATYAKRPDNMPLYFKTDIGNAAADTEGLAQAMAAGGLPLQTVVSNNLVKAGQMFRRERSYDGVQISSVFDTGNRDLHENLSNEATKALRALVSADKSFHSVYVKTLGQALAAQGESVQDSAGNQAAAGVQHTEFSSVVHNFVKQMLLGLKAQSAADEAIASLKRGEKPIIAVESTMGSFLNEYATSNNIAQGEELGAFDYRTVLTRALERSRVIIIKDAQGNETKRKVPLSELDVITTRAYQRAQAVIDGLKLSIPVSPIDWMRAQIIKAGYSVAEITGRNLSVDYSNPSKPILSAIDQLEQSDKVNTTRQFNSGKLDALILNVAGSTGISLHASEKFSDQHQRHMIVAQAAGDINIFMQMLGRIHRTGQVALPKYTILSVDLPTEKRPTAVLSGKMKSLNANTSSNTESATSVKTSDILNKYGDQIVSQYLVDNYALAVALDVQDLIGGEDAQDDIARKVTGRLALQPIEVQHAFYDEVEGQYNALIEYLNKTNQNDLEPRTFDFDAKETRQEVLFEGPDKSTPFGEDAIYGEYSIKAQGIAMKPEEIRDAMKISLDGKESVAHVNGLVNDLLTTWTAQVNANRAKNGLMPGAFDADKYGAFMAGLYGKDAAAGFVERATKQIASGQEVQDITVAAMENTQGTSEGMEFMREHAIGKTFRIDINSEPYNAVVTNIRSTHKTTGSPFSLSKVQLTVSVNGALRSLTIPGTQFRKIVVSSIQGGYRIDQLFKEQPANQRETAKIVTGNLLAAYGEIEGARGTIISFTKQDGTTEQGILLPKLFDYSKNTRGDYRLSDGAAALRFLQQSDNKDIGRFGITSRDGNVRVLPAGQGVRVQVPKSKAKGGKFFLDKALIEAGGDFVSSGNYMVSIVYDTQPAEAMLDLLMKKQALYALPSMAEEAKAMGEVGASPNVFKNSRIGATSPMKLSLDAVKKSVQSALKRIPNAPTIEVHTNPGAIGLVTPNSIVPKGVTLDNGSIVIFSDNAESVLDVFQTVFHELFHRGSKVRFTSNADYIKSMLDIAASDITVRDLVAQWKVSSDGQDKLSEYESKGPMTGDRLANYEALAIEEALAQISEKFADKPVARKLLLRRVANFLSKVAKAWGMDGLANWLKDKKLSQTEQFVLDTVRMSGGAPNLFSTALLFRSGSISSTLTDAANNVRGVKLAAGYEVGDLINGVPGKLNWWHRTVGTQYNLAQRSKPFKRVFDSVQNFIGDVSYFASEAADLAPNILPKLENLKDIGKSPLSADDTKAISAPIFEGTLTWGRDESGKPVKMEVLEAAAAKLTTDQKSQRLLRGNHVTDKTLRMWRGLPIDQYTAIIDGKYERDMLKAGVVWTDAELKSLFKLTDKQIPLYREFRAATDKSLTNLAIADMLRFAGKDVEPIRDVVLDAKTPKEAADTLAEYLRSLAAADGERSDVLMDTADKVIGKGDKAQDLMDRGYAPLSRFGKYTLDVVDENGDRVYFGMFENRFDAAKMNRQMQASFPGATINQGTVSEQAYTLFAGVTPETLELFGDMLGLESTGDGAANEAFQTYLKLAKSSRSAMKRLIQRKGIAGFSEDAGRVLAGFIYSNARQTSSSLHMGEMTQAATDKDAFRNQGELQDAAAKLVDYIKNPQEEAQAFRGLLFAQYIGGSIASAMVNMTQPITMTLPWLAQFGGITSAAKQMASAVKDANKPLTGNAKLDAALKRAEEDGTVSPQEVHQLMQQAQGRGTLKSGDGTMAGNALATANNTLSRVMLAWGKPFSWAEQFNRRSTFIAAYRTAVAQGMTDPDAFARRAISETQGIYNKGNKPAWARGAAGSILFTFKQYSISYVEMLSRMAKNGPEGKRAALLALGILFLLSGAGGMPGADDLDDLISGALQSMGYNFDSRTKRQAFFAEMFGQGGAQFLERGISGLPGTPIDVSGRMGLGNLIPGTGLFVKKVDHTRDVVELAGPGGDLVKRGFEAGSKLIKGEILGANGAAVTIAPKAAQNLHKAFDMANMGMYRDAKGAKVIDTDATDAVMKAIGFQPNDVKKVQDASFEAQRMIGLNKLTESELAARWALGLFEKDSDKVKAAREDLAEWNRVNPESPIRIKFTQVLQRVKKMNETKAERMIKTAPQEIRNAVRAELEASR